jgi:catechol 2,3-dioxygenase
VFLKCWDEHEHHSVILRYAATYGLEHMGFKVEHADDLELFERRVEKDGGQVTRHARGELAPGHGEAIRFQTPTGHRCELVHGMEKVGNLLPRTNPPPRPMGLVGIAPPRLDHIFVTAEDVDSGTRFFRDVLGFRLTEQILADDGHQLATWLEVSHTPTTSPWSPGPNGGLHHFAFWLDDWNEVRAAADILAYHGVPIDVGPTRHGATRGYTVYFFDPLGNRNEVFTGGYWVDPDHEVVTWTEAEMGRAIFYYERRRQPEVPDRAQLNPGGRRSGRGPTARGRPAGTRPDQRGPRGVAATAPSARQRPCTWQPTRPPRRGRPPDPRRRRRRQPPRCTAPVPRAAADPDAPDAAAAALERRAARGSRAWADVHPQSRRSSRRPRPATYQVNLPGPHHQATSGPRGTPPTETA